MRWHLGDVRRRVAHNRAHSNRRLGGCDSCLWVPPRLCAGRTTGCVSDEPLFAYTRAARKLRQTEVGAFHEGNVVRVTTDQLSQDPSFSPDGSQVVFSSGRDGEFDPEVGYSRLALFTANWTGVDEERLTSGVYNYEPDWSPDGAKVVFRETPVLREPKPAGGISSAGGVVDCRRGQQGGATPSARSPLHAR